MRKPVVFRGSAREKIEKGPKGACGQDICRENVCGIDGGTDEAGAKQTAQALATAEYDGACCQKEPEAMPGEPAVELSELTDVKESLEELCDKLL